MTFPKEWRDEQGRYFRAEDGAFTLNSDLGSIEPSKPSVPH